VSAVSERGGLVRAAPVLALAALGTSSGAVLVRLAEAPASVTAFWRLALSVLLLLPAFVASRGWRDWTGMSRRDVALLGLAGVCLAFHFIAWFRSLAFTSVASSTVLVSVHPLFVGALSALWLREPPSRVEWVGIGIAVLGAGCIGWGDLRGGPDPLRGDLLALLAAGLGALYFTVGRRLRARLGIWSYAVPVYASAAVACASFALVEGAPITGWPAGTWAAFVGLAVGPMLLGHTGFNWALRHVRAYVVSLVQLLEPIGATILAVLVLGRHEVPGWNVWLGGALILVGVWLPLRARLRAPAAHHAEEGGEV
jgi:drug/metabolite transporter (DMT)-like permease